ncbi:MAG: hypothetical protein ACFFEY_07960 [Candidatus Thorarchaeota archaeon]
MSDIVIKKLFQVFVNKLEFDPADYLVSSEEQELTNFQKDVIEKATIILKDNIVGDVKAFGGNLKVNEEKIKELEKRANEELENEEYEDIKKDLKNYIKKVKELIEKTCVAIIPVKEMPWVDVLFRTVPRIVFNKKLELLDNTIAYYGEIKCLISRPTIFGKMRNEKPLFAPVMGTIDLAGYKMDETTKSPKSHIYSYVSAIINSLESTMTRNHLAKYHEAYQRHGDPICDFLLKDDELIKSMEKITSGLESERIVSDNVVYAMALPQSSEKTSLVIVLDEGKDPDKYLRCFEALLRFSAECCNVPSHISLTPTQMASQQPEVMRTTGSQEMRTWTAEELAEQAQKRMDSQPDIPTWSEEELAKFAEERGTALPPGMEVWTEEELTELAKKRQGGLDIPEWEVDETMKECVKCGYSLRPGWSRCPVCETPVSDKPPTESIPEQDEKPPEQKSVDESEIKTEKPSEEINEKKLDDIEEENNNN